MTLQFDESDLDTLYQALGCMTPENSVHKPLAILIGKLEVQRVAQEQEERAIIEDDRGKSGV